MSARHVVVDVTSRRARSRGETKVDNGLRGRRRNRKVREFPQRSGVTFVYFKEVKIRHTNGSGFPMHGSCGTRRR